VSVESLPDFPLDGSGLGRQFAAMGLNTYHAAADHVGPYPSGSGEVALGFTTAFRIPHFPDSPTVPIEMLREDGALIDAFFAAVTEATEEAILNSLINAKSVTGRGGERREAIPLDLLRELAEDMR
jgi:D-aminopeptidase